MTACVLLLLLSLLISLPAVEETPLLSLLRLGALLRGCVPLANDCSSHVGQPKG